MMPASTRNESTTPAAKIQPCSAHGARFAMGVLDEAHHLDAEHREDARHEVQQDAAEEARRRGAASALPPSVSVARGAAPVVPTGRRGERRRQRRAYLDRLARDSRPAAVADRHAR